MSFKDRYQKIRDQLDAFGFHQPLSFESLTLVGNLLTALQQTKESLDRSQKVAQLKQDGHCEVETELKLLRLDNEGIRNENDHLKRKIEQIQEENGKSKRDLKLQVVDLENKVSDLEFVNTEQLIKVQELEEEIIKYSTRHPSEFIHPKCWSQSQPEQSKVNKSQLNELASSFLHFQKISPQEVINLKKENESLKSAVDKFRSKVADKDGLVKNLLEEVKHLRSAKSIYKKPCSCHEKDKNFHSKNVKFEAMCGNPKSKVSNVSSSYSTVDFNHTDDSGSMCLCTKCKPRNCSKLSGPDVPPTFVDLESCILELKAKLESKTNENEKLSASETCLREEKLQLINKLESVSKAELELIHQMNDLFKENVVLRGQVAALEESTKNKHVVKAVKHQMKSKALSLTSKKFQEAIKSSEEKENQCDPNKEEDIKNMVKDQVENYMKNMKESLPITNTEKEEFSRKQFLNTILQERDHFYCQFQKLRTKVNFVLKNLKNMPAFECPFACVDQISYALSCYEKRIEELSSSNSNITQAPKFQCSCSTTDLSAVIKSYEIKLKEIETREIETSSLKEMLTMKLHSTQEECIRLKNRIDTLTKDNVNLKAKYSELKLLCEEVERSLRNAEDNKKICEAELACALSKIKKLDCQKSKLQSNQITLEFEKNNLKKNLVQIDQEKDLLSIKLDEKTEKIVELERELKSNLNKVQELEENVNKLDQSLRALQRMRSNSEINMKMTEKSTSKLRTELQELKSKKESLTKENRRLQDDLSAALRDCVKCNHDLSEAKLEIEELKLKLQSYVSEVRRIEDLLQSKEEERRSLLEQLKGMNADSLSVNSKSLDRSSIPAEAVSDLQDRLLTYETEVQDKNNMLLRMEEEMENLKLQVKSLESELAFNYSGFTKTKNVCAVESSQADDILKRVLDEREQLKESLSQLRDENGCLHETLREAQSSGAILEDTLSQTRKETLEESAKNKYLSHQVRKLEEMILQLKEQLDSAKKDFNSAARGKSKRKLKSVGPKNDRTW